MEEEKTSVEQTDGSQEQEKVQQEAQQEEVQEEAQKVEPEGSGSKAGKQKKDKFHKMQERITHLTSEKLSYKHQLSKAQKELAKLKKTAGSEPVIPDVSHYKDDYGDIDHQSYNKAMADYQKSLLSWHESQKEMTALERQAQVDMEAKIEMFNEAAEAVRAKYADFDEVVEKPVFSQQLRDVLLDNQMAEVTYYLGSNEREALKLSKMPPLQMMKELGKLEEKISGMVPTPSKAPEPITPVSDDSSFYTKGKMSDEEWFKKAEQDRYQKLKERY